MKRNSWIAYILLFSFVVVIAPRNVFHSCSHTQEIHTKNSDKKGFVFEKKIPTCHFCSYDLSLSEEAIKCSFSFHSYFSKPKPEIAFSCYFPITDNLKLRRGPPTI